MSKLYEAIQEQVGRELLAHHTYLSLALWCDANSYNGAAKYFYHASDEEYMHAKKFLSFLNDYFDKIPSVPAVGDIRVIATSLLDCFNKQLQLELAVTKAISNLGAIAEAEGDHATCAFLQWFLDEQVTSVSESRGLVRLVTSAGNNILEADEQIGEMVE